MKTYSQETAEYVRIISVYLRARQVRWQIWLENEIYYVGYAINHEIEMVILKEDPSASPVPFPLSLDLEIQDPTNDLKLKEIIKIDPLKVQRILFIPKLGAEEFGMMEFVRPYWGAGVAIWNLPIYPRHQSSENRSRDVWSDDALPRKVGKYWPYPIPRQSKWARYLFN